ncbi:MAG: sigma-70 family RNA polymerase sigma factor [Bacteroidota bacterium]
MSEPTKDRQNTAETTALIERCRSGDLTAFTALMHKHQNYAYRIAFHVIQNEDSARDIVQEAFIRVWKHLSRYHESARFTTWLYKIVVRLCYDRLKMESRRQRMFRPIDTLMGESDPTDGRNPETEAQAKDAAAHIMLIAKTLPPKQQLVFMLRDVEDCALEEIAEIAEMSIGTVKANLSYARKAIREAYAHLEGK